MVSFWDDIHVLITWFICTSLFVTMFILNFECDHNYKCHREIIGCCSVMISISAGSFVFWILKCVRKWLKIW